MFDKESQQTYVVVGSKPWNRRIFDEVIKKNQGKWHFIGKKERVTLKNIQELNPRYIFFVHWSWKVPDEIINNYECICFHMTDVPYGRGGSPLQNLIIRGHKNIKLTALKMTSDFDAGPVYLKEELSIEGGAEEIFIRQTNLSAQLINRIIHEQIKPTQQKGKKVIFKRRKPDESEIQEFHSLQSLYDFLRMLDAEGYPKAFIKHKGFQYTFSRAALYNGKIVADVTITKLKETKQ